jgi:hypothetical protein
VVRSERTVHLADSSTGVGHQQREVALTDGRCVQSPKPRRLAEDFKRFGVLVLNPFATPRTRSLRAGLTADRAVAVALTLRRERDGRRSGIPCCGVEAKGEA